MGTIRTPVDLKHCTLKILDGGAGTAQQSITMRIGNGTMSWTEKKTIDYVKDRGLLDTTKLGDEDPLEVRVDCTYTFLTKDGSNSNEIITPEDALKQRGSASAWVSSSSDSCEPYAVDLKLIYTPVCSGVLQEVALFPDFRYESIEHDLKNGMLIFSGKCNATQPTVSRPTNTVT